ncbi:MAG: hypothetical protein JOZ78_00555 [Chroococcidiopsidaceae cyanobacterium CP_BM_ER_R8_30]|nr:hypothetical protein [Chroococcidiopsidaceae cyanobacterium CP_BM_ER_R8_30]
MPGLGDIVQKAIYLGVGLASYAGERAGGRLGELKSQIQKLADEMVSRGEMTTEEARRLVEELMRQAQQSPASEASAGQPSSEPRRIEILSDEDEPESGSSQKPDVQSLRDQVLGLQEELQRLKRDR